MSKKKNYCVYLHTVPKEISGYEFDKYYVGQTCVKPERRWNNGNGYDGQVFYNAIQCYGWDNIKHEILIDGLSSKEADDLEKFYIGEYKSNDGIHGYNITNGGDGGSGLFGELNPNSKKVICLELKKIYANACEAERETGVNNRNISSCCTGKRTTAGTYHWEFFDNTFDYTEEYINKKCNIKTLGKHKCKPVICLETGIHYESATKAGVKLGLNNKYITDCCKGKRNNTGGYHFEYYDEKFEYTKEYCNEKCGIKCGNIKSVICVETGKNFDSVKEASIKLGLCKSAISACCRGERKSTGNLHFMYYSDYIAQQDKEQAIGF